MPARLNFEFRLKILYNTISYWLLPFSRLWTTVSWFLLLSVSFSLFSCLCQSLQQSVRLVYIIIKYTLPLLLLLMLLFSLFRKCHRIQIAYSKRFIVSKLPSTMIQLANVYLIENLSNWFFEVIKGGNLVSLSFYSLFLHHDYSCAGIFLCFSSILPCYLLEFFFPNEYGM